MNEPRHKIFVYGSLLRGEPFHHLLAEATFVGNDRTAGGFLLVDLGPYPALVNRSPGPLGGVVGEVYELEKALLSVLDAYEEHPKVYRRVSIELESGRAAEAYVLPPGRAEGYPVIASGDWRSRRRSD